MADAIVSNAKSEEDKNCSYIKGCIGYTYSKTNN